MNHDLAALLRTSGGVVHYQDVPLRLIRALEWATRRGQVARPFPQVYVDAGTAQRRDVARRAALCYAGEPAALSAASALELWDLPVRAEAPTDITVPANRRVRWCEGLVLSRRKGFRPEPPLALIRRGLPVVRLERALVETWSLSPGDAWAALLLAVQERLTTPERILAEVTAMPNVRGRAQLLALGGLLKQGCRSELELWGYRHVFAHPSLPPSARSGADSSGLANDLPRPLV